MNCWAYDPLLKFERRHAVKMLNIAIRSRLVCLLFANEKPLLTFLVGTLQTLPQ